MKKPRKPTAAERAAQAGKEAAQRARLGKRHEHLDVNLLPPYVHEEFLSAYALELGED